MRAVVFDSSKKEHRPIALGETIEPHVIPLSLLPGNQIIQYLDGLYVGDTPIPGALKVDAGTGIDQPPTETTINTPLKTLDYALSVVASVKPTKATILLKVGQLFPLLSSFTLEGVDLTVAFYDDSPSAKYPSDSYLPTSKILSRYMEDLARPVIQSNYYKSSTTDCWIINNITLKESTLRFHGVSITIPASPSGALPDTYYGKGCDFLIAQNSAVHLDGVIVNKLSEDSSFGLMAIPSRYKADLAVNGTQLLVKGLKVNSANINAKLFTSNVQTMSHLKYFFKFYLDVPGDDSVHSEIAINRGPRNSGLLNLMWGQLNSYQNPATGTYTLDTYPVADIAFGLQNYFHNLTRDQQSRPLNISCSILF